MGSPNSQQTYQKGSDSETGARPGNSGAYALSQPGEQK